MRYYEELNFGNFYHIYNHGVGNRDLFLEPDNYEYFLSLWDKYISPIADTYAWVLMKNHFHALVKIKEESEIVAALQALDLTGFENLSGVKPPHQYFSNLFNAYSKALNKRIGIHGALFERPFGRKLIDNQYYLKRIILYIHNIPVHHGFCSHPIEYPWCSYMSCVSIKPTKLHRKAVIGWFDGEANFKTMHEGKFDIGDMDEWLGIG
jgi:REP element-mobilizing transposase RayT